MTERVPKAWAARMSSAALDAALTLWDRAAVRRAEGEAVLPRQSDIFRALVLTPPERVRCVIVGQDPYHTPGVANGLAFSANAGCKIPPSLRNIFKELSTDLGVAAPSSPDLTPWAVQGALLLNASLTVRAGAADSHANWGWRGVTGDLLRVCATLPQPVMFLLWGRHAQAAAQKAGIVLSEQADAPAVDALRDLPDLFAQDSRKRTLCSSHPSPLGAAKPCGTFPPFLGSRPFSRTNAFLRSVGVRDIDWRLT